MFYALSKFAPWVIKQGGHADLIQMTLQGIQETDSNVQESACTCLALLLQSCFDEPSLNMSDLTAKILEVLLVVVARFKGAALTSLYDCLSVLSNAPQFKDHFEIVLRILNQHWAAIGNQERRLLPLLECFDNCVR